MGRIASVIGLALGMGAAVAMVSCGGRTESPTAPQVAPTPSRSSISIYRDGDPRFALSEENVFRPDGSASKVEPTRFLSPVALVVETVETKLAAGRSRVSFPRIPAQADPASIWIESMARDDEVVLESLEPRKAADRVLLGQEIRARVGDEVIVGTAVFVTSKEVSVRTSDGHLWLLDPGAIDIELREDVHALPVVVFASKRGATHPIAVGYSTAAIDWTIDYDVSADTPDVAGKGTATVNGAIAIRNQTDSDFQDSALAVHSGTLQSKRHPVPIWSGRASIGAHERLTLPLPSTTYAAVRGAEYRPGLRTEGGNRRKPTWGQISTTNVVSTLSISTTEDAPLFAGRMRVRIDGELFESVLRERVLGKGIATIRLEVERDLIGRRRQVGTQVSGSGESLTEVIELVVENRGSQTAAVTVVDSLIRSSQFELIESKPKAVLRGNELRAELEIEPKKTASLKYRVRYSF